MSDFLILNWARSFLTAICRTFMWRLTKTSDVVMIKIMTLKSPGVEIRIPFLICYLQSLYENKLGHYFCPKCAGQVTNQNILVEVENVM